MIIPSFLAFPYGWSGSWACLGFLVGCPCVLCWIEAPFPVRNRDSTQSVRSALRMPDWCPVWRHYPPSRPWCFRGNASKRYQCDGRCLFQMWVFCFWSLRRTLIRRSLLCWCLRFPGWWVWFLRGWKECYPRLTVFICPWDQGRWSCDWQQPPRWWLVICCCGDWCHCSSWSCSCPQPLKC